MRLPEPPKPWPGSPTHREGTLWIPLTTEGEVHGHLALEGIAAEFIGHDALIQNKEATGRAKDRGDAEELRKRSRNE